MAPCRFFQRGNCRFGDKCRFEHIKLEQGESQLQKRARSPSDRPSEEMKKVKIESKAKKTPKVKKVPKAPATPRPPKYVPPTFQPSETVRYTFSSGQNLWNTQTKSYSKIEHVDWSKLDVAGIKNVEFGSNSISETPTLQNSSNVLNSVLNLNDSTPGTRILEMEETSVMNRNSSALSSFVKNMRVFHLEAFTSLSDATLTAIFESCPKIESVHLSGHDKGHGRVTGPALRDLTSKPHLAPSLKVLYLYDQTFDLENRIKQLSRARPTLFIHNGETLGDGIADNMVAAMSGGVMTFSWLGGKMDSMDTDYGLYGPGGHDLDMSFMMDDYGFDDYGFDDCGFDGFDDYGSGDYGFDDYGFGDF